MRHFGLGLAAVVCASACLDFDRAKQECLERRGCAGALAPPTVVSTVPVPGAVNVSTRTAVEVVFSLPMETASVQLTFNPQVPRATAAWSEEDTQLALALADPLENSRQYVLTISGRSAQGVEMDTVEVRFTTEAVVDVVPPVISATTPANAATMIPIGARLSITFSEPMDTATVSVSAAPTFDFGAPSWSTEKTTVSFSAPPSPFQPLTTYVLTIAGADLAGNGLAGQTSVTFTTASTPDTTAPTVVATIPLNGAQDVDPALAPSISFSEGMEPLKTRAAFTITPPVSGGCTLAFDGSGSTLSCQHATPFAGSTTYTLSVGTGAEDVSGNALAQPFSWSFTTKDTASPTIISVTPANSTNNREPNQAITVTFSEPMDKAATQAALQVTSPGAPGNAGSFSWDTPGTVLTFTPTAWPNNQVVQWQVSTAARDLAGNTLAATATYQFKVRGLYSVVIPFSEDGYVRGDGLFQTNSWTSVGWIKGTLPTALPLRGFFAVDLPANALMATSLTATLRIYLDNCNSGTHAAYGNVYVEGVDYGILDATDYNAATFCSTCSAVLVSSSDAAGERSADVSAWLSSAVAQGKGRVGMRLRMGAEGTTPPSVDRWARFDPIEGNPSPPTRPQVDLTYRVP
ncbi:MAG: Ig-like domain-containing protein [Myxococcota bacterium]